MTPPRLFLLCALFLPEEISPFALQSLRAAEPAAAPAGGDCEICEGEGKIVCPRCAGKGKYCKNCRNQEKGPCEACRGKGETACAQCKGLPSTTCAACAGRGEVWVPRKRIWGKEGLRNVQDLRGRIPRVKVHCLKVGEAVEFEGPARFWHDLAEAGAGEILSLGTEADAVKDLCGTIPPGIPASDLHRIIRAILRVEEEKREFRRARGAAGY